MTGPNNKVTERSHDFMTHSTANVCLKQLKHYEGYLHTVSHLLYVSHLEIIYLIFFSLLNSGNLSLSYSADQRLS